MGLAVPKSGCGRRHSARMTLGDECAPGGVSDPQQLPLPPAHLGSEQKRREAQGARTSPQQPLCLAPDVLSLGT